jgi:formin 2
MILTFIFIFFVSGQMLINWLAASFQALPVNINEQELTTITLQYCTNMLAMGVIKQIADKYAPLQDTFKVSTFAF